MIREDTSEAGVENLRDSSRTSAGWSCCAAPGAPGPEVVTPHLVADLLGGLLVDPLLPAVRTAIAAERLRLAAESERGPPFDERLDRMAAEPALDPAHDRTIDLARTRRVLDGEAGGARRREGPGHLVIAGLGITGVWRGAFIDERNMISLPRFQMLVWTVLVLSAYGKPSR